MFYRAVAVLLNLLSMCSTAYAVFAAVKAVTWHGTRITALWHCSWSGSPRRSSKRLSFYPSLCCAQEVNVRRSGISAALVALRCGVAARRDSGSHRDWGCHGANSRKVVMTGKPSKEAVVGSGMPITPGSPSSPPP